MLHCLPLVVQSTPCLILFPPFYFSYRWRRYFLRRNLFRVSDQIIAARVCCFVLQLTKSPASPNRFSLGRESYEIDKHRSGLLLSRRGAEDGRTRPDKNDVRVTGPRPCNIQQNRKQIKLLLDLFENLSECERGGRLVGEGAL